MANYSLNHYSTGPKDTYAEAALALHTFMERLEGTTNPIIGQGIAETRRAQRCVGWVLFEGFFLDGAYHDHVADNIVLAVS